MRVPKTLQASPAATNSSSGPIQAKMPPAFQLQAAPLQLKKNPVSLTTCPVIDDWTDAQLQEEINLLSQWILSNSTDPRVPQFTKDLKYYKKVLSSHKEPLTLSKCLFLDGMTADELETEIDRLQYFIEKNPSHADLHRFIMLITEYRDKLREKQGIKQDPEKVTKKDYDKMYSENNKKVDGKWKAKSIGHRAKNIKKLNSPTGHQAGEGGWLEANADNQALFDAYFGSVLPSGVTVDDLKILSSDFTKHNPGYKELPPPDLWPATKESLKLIKKIQGMSGLTFDIASAYRSFRVNAHAGGSKGSSHMKFLGLDLKPLGDKSKNEAFLKYYYLKNGHAEKMGFGFYSTSRQHIDATKRRSWAWGGKKSKKKDFWRKRVVKLWGEDTAKKIDDN